MAARPPLCDAADVAARLGVANDDAHLAAAVARASSNFRGQTRRLITRVAADTLELNGHTGQWLHLPNGPIVSVASVTLDGVTVDATEYEVDKAGARLRRLAGWPAALSGVVVTYTHGYLEDLTKGSDEGGIPEDIREAVAERAEMIYNTRAGIQTYTTGGESFTTRVGATQDWMEAVNNYKLDRAHAR